MLDLADMFGLPFHLAMMVFLEVPVNGASNLCT